MCRQYGQDSETAMEKEEILLKKRIQDLARTAYQRDYVTFSDFLDLNEQNIVHSLKPEELGASVRFFGGYEGAERQIAAFLPDALSYEADIPYPLACLRIEPLSRKFSEPLTHRDYLGALVHLGIERAMLGDILVRQQEAYVFCHSRMREFLEENVTGSGTPASLYNRSPRRRICRARSFSPSGERWHPYAWTALLLWPFLLPAAVCWG